MAADTAAMSAEQGKAEALHRSYLLYRRGFYLKLALALCTAALLAFIVHDPPRGHGGGTWLGYTLGITAALLLAWLAWFGVRKRQFRDGSGTARAWLSAHVYLGLTAWFFATLHSALQFGWSLHTLAYVLLTLVAASGVYGVIAYATLPERITRNLRESSPGALLDEIAALEESALRLADRIDPETHEVVARSVSRVRIGGGVRAQLTGRYRQTGEGLEQFLEKKKGQLVAKAVAKASPQPARGGRQGTIAFVTDQLFAAAGEAGGADLKRLLDTLSQRDALVERLNRDITLRARQNIWLFLHVPLTVALLAAVIAHVLSVFIYR